MANNDRIYGKVSYGQRNRVPMMAGAAPFTAIKVVQDAYEQGKARAWEQHNDDADDHWETHNTAAAAQWRDQWFGARA